MFTIFFNCLPQIWISMHGFLKYGIFMEFFNPKMNLFINFVQIFRILTPIHFRIKFSASWILNQRILAHNTFPSQTSIIFDFRVNNLSEVLPAFERPIPVKCTSCYLRRQRSCIEQSQRVYFTRNNTPESNRNLRQ